MISPDLPEEAWLAALLALPGVGPARLKALLVGRTAKSVWTDARAGAPEIALACGKPDLARSWMIACRGADVSKLWARYRQLDIGVLGRGSPGYPGPLLDDPEPPAVLFTQGDPAAVGPLRVGIVGTRQCTRYGVDLAYELGGMLASSGVTVVSGLAIGIDAAAHSGAIDAGGAPPVAVVGTGLDTPYPRQNSELWRRVRAEGLVCGETPLDTPVERWRFPARNRIIAGLCQVVIVVESHVSGGSLYTATEAMDRDRTVYAVPGSIRSPASAGCNRLLADGCLPLCEVSDAMLAVGLLIPTIPAVPPMEVSDVDRALLEAMGWSPITLDELASVADMPFDD
ncbi:MAG: DNA-processing protein DprA, partial [Acidimicrobiales bacterium]